jgi:hypothetical protein
MKTFIVFIFASLTIVSCGTNTTNLQVDNLSKTRYPALDKDNITKIELLIADSSIIDPLHKELPRLTPIGLGLSFIDSAGNQILVPTQKITVTGSEKNIWVDIFNNYLEVPQDTTIGTACDVSYRHVFILYNPLGKINEQIYLCLDCTKFDFIKRHAFLQFLDQKKILFDQLIKALKNRGAYVPNYGPASILTE